MKPPCYTINCRGAPGGYPRVKELVLLTTHARYGMTRSTLTPHYLPKLTQGTYNRSKIGSFNPSEFPYNSNALIKRSIGTDLAIVKFTSTQPYQVATLGNYRVPDKSLAFPDGWPDPQNIKSQQWQWQLNPGIISSQENGQFD
jgi:hypothetical protein